MPHLNRSRFDARADFETRTPSGLAQAHSGRLGSGQGGARSFASNRDFQRLRLCNISWLSPSGALCFDEVRIRSPLVFQTVCGNVAYGTVLQTADGPMAVEDVLPGQKLLTSQGDYRQIKWMSSYEFSPADSQIVGCRLYRIAQDAFGVSKPSHDLVLAPYAHVMVRRRMYGADNVLASVAGLEDGENVIALSPAASVTLFNISLDAHATVLANNLEVESFHPSVFSRSLLGRNQQTDLLSLFPHVRMLEDFGTQMIRRVTRSELQQ